MKHAGLIEIEANGTGKEIGWILPLKGQDERGKEGV